VSTRTAGRSQPTPLPLDTRPDERAGKVRSRTSWTSRKDAARRLRPDTPYRVTTSVSTLVERLLVDGRISTHFPVFRSASRCAVGARTSGNDKVGGRMRKRSGKGSAAVVVAAAIALAGAPGAGAQGHPAPVPGRRSEEPGTSARSGRRETGSTAERPFSHPATHGSDFSTPAPTGCNYGAFRGVPACPVSQGFPPGGAATPAPTPPPPPPPLTPPPGPTLSQGAHAIMDKTYSASIAYARQERREVDLPRGRACARPLGPGRELSD
jgi:hypothetical protein